MATPYRSKNRRLLTGYGVSVIIFFALGISFLATHTEYIVNLVASSISSLGGATTTIFFSAYGDTTLHIGDTTNIDVNINTRIPINALGATISFPKDTIEIVGISKEKSFFTLWTEDTSISEDAGEIHFSGGTTKEGGMMGTGTVITLVVRAKNTGTAKLVFTNTQTYPSNGSGTAVENATHSISYTIEDKKTSPGVIPQISASISVPSSPIPNPDLNEDGVINLVDFSILTFKMFNPYDPRFDLNINGSIGLDDLSILLSKIH